MFSYELQFIEISTSETSVPFRLLNGSEALLSERYVPDKNGRILLYDLNDMIESAIGDAPRARFAIYLGNAIVSTFDVLRCSVAMDGTAEEFLGAHFLTSGTGMRTTAPGRYELLNFVEPGEVKSPVTVTRTLRSLSSKRMIYTSAFTLLAADDYDVGTIVTVDVSPDFIFKFDGLTDYELLEYTVSCGARSQRYRVTEPVPADPSVIYRNRFNVWDTYHFAGTKESDPQFERSQMWINGQYVTYRTQEVLQYKAMTHPVPLGMECYVEDIARSAEVHRMDETGAARELLTVLDCDIKAVNDDDALNVFTLTYRYADKISAKSFTGARHRVFDNTFDNSYE